MQKETRGDQVTARISLHFGDENSLKGRDTAAQMAGRMLMRGTTKHTRQQIRDEFTRLKANVNVSGSAEGAAASITTTREYLKPVLDLVAEILREPSFPADEFDQLKQEALAGLERSKSEPAAIASRAMQRHLSPYPKDDIRYVETIEEAIDNTKNVTLAQVKDFHKSFYGASYGEVAIVGDFEPEITQKQLSDLFNDWKTPVKFANVMSPFKPIDPKKEAFNTPDKANSLWLAAIPLKLKDSDPDYPALMFGNYILGQMPLNNRLFARIRNKEGLSYGAGSMLRVDAEDDGGLFIAQAICAPQNAPRVEAAFLDELNKIISAGYSAEEVEAAKKAWLQNRTMSRAGDPQLAGALASQRYLDRTMQWDKAMEEKVSALTPQQIQAAMKKYLDLSRASIFRAGDFEKAKVTW